MESISNMDPTTCGKAMQVDLIRLAIRIALNYLGLFMIFPATINNSFIKTLLVELHDYAVEYSRIQHFEHCCVLGNM